MQHLMFDSGGCKGRLRAYPYLGTWRTLICGEVIFVLEWLVATWNVFFAEGGPRIIIVRSEVQAFRSIGAGR